MSGSGTLRTLDDAPTTKVRWRWTVLTAAGNYLDAGSTGPGLGMEVDEAAAGHYQIDA